MRRDGDVILEYNGEINLTFLPGLPAGQYVFVAHTTELQYPGLTDSAGNPLDDTTVPNEGKIDFSILFDIQPQPVYITGMALESTYSVERVDGRSAVSSRTSSCRRRTGRPTRVTTWRRRRRPWWSTSRTRCRSATIRTDVQLIQSSNAAGGASDGDFGTLGEGGLGSTGHRLHDVCRTTRSRFTTTTRSPRQSSVVVPGGSGNRLVLQLDPGNTLTADDYRVYIPNQVEPDGLDTRIFDIYNNQLDGENLGNQTSQPSVEFPSLPNYEDLQSDGTNRQNDMSGDGVAGGAFTAGFTVVNYGNVVFARPDYVENPLLPSTLSDGSLAKPYPVLAPEGNPNTAPANSSHNPNGGLNSTFFYQPGNFNHAYDFSGDGVFEQSALYAASQLTYVSQFSAGGPVVVVALAGIPQRNPVTGLVTEASFVLQAPAGNNSGVTNGSASVPFNTTLSLPGRLDAQITERRALRAEPGECTPGAWHGDESGHVHVIQRREHRRSHQRQSGHQSVRGRLGRNRLPQLRRNQRRPASAASRSTGHWSVPAAERRLRALPT